MDYSFSNKVTGLKASAIREIHLKELRLPIKDGDSQIRVSPSLRNTLQESSFPYGEIRFEGEDIPSIKSLDTDGRVIYVGSFSKTPR